MAIRKSNDRSNESDSKYNNIKLTHKAENITERFDDTTHNDNPYDDAIQYINKKLDDCIDEINLSDSSKVITSAQASAITANTAKTGTTSTERSRITANHAKVGTTSTERSRITANHAKVGISTVQAAIVDSLHPEGGALIPTTTEKHTVSLSVTNDRGTYALVFTMVDSSGRTPVTKTATVNLG
tara:strand:- start:577 stop:1131 length:555 start_codon:yes stop_codon:yes gene_type:complete